MLITSVKLKNFGIHRELEFHPNNESVVGLLGPNGGGKSTVLKAIEFAFTGGLDDNTATYIRTGEKRAEVEVDFIKNGRKGSIYRKITPTTSSRQLMWDGAEKPITKASEVDALLAEVMGADKQAVANAVFLAQGSLDKILFGDQTEREKLFTRLVNISHIEKVARILDGKIATLAGGLEDFSVLKDELNANLVTTHTRVGELDNTLRSHQDHSHRVAWLEQRLSVDRNLTNLAATREQTAGRQALFAGQLQSQLATYHADSPEVVEARAEVQQQAVDQARETFNTYKQGLLKRQLREQNLEYKQQVTQRLTEALQRIAVLHPWATADLTGLRNSIAQERNRQKVEATGTDLANRVKQTTQALQQLVAEPQVDEKQVVELAHEIELGHASVSGADLTITTLEAAISATRQANLATAQQDCSCPICERPIAPDLIKPERLKQLKEVRQAFVLRLTSSQTRHRELVAKKTSRDTRYRSLAEELTRLITAQAQWKVQMAQFPPAIDVSELEKRCRQIEAAATETRGLNQNASTYQRQLVQFQAELDKEKDVDLTGFTDAGIAQLEAAKLQVEKDFQVAQNAWLAVKPLVAQVLRSSGELETLRRQENDASVTLVEVNRHRPADVLEADHELEAALAAAKQHQEARQQLIGQVAQVREQLENLRRRQTELQLREEATQARRRAVEDLRQVSNVLERPGLPMTYVTYRFQQLVELTRRNLALLEANFTVKLDPDKVVSFLFTRLDDPAATDLPQSKLSGGQRVRLAVAFLLSVQQLLMPELGLLVLDEPSTHLDLEGVENLKELLLNMNQTLQNAQHQVWIVDHHPALEPALGACLQVGESEKRGPDHELRNVVLPHAGAN